MRLPSAFSANCIAKGSLRPSFRNINSVGLPRILMKCFEQGAPTRMFVTRSPDSSPALRGGFCWRTATLHPARSFGTGGARTGPVSHTYRQRRRTKPPGRRRRGRWRTAFYLRYGLLGDLFVGPALSAAYAGFCRGTENATSSGGGLANYPSYYLSRLKIRLGGGCTVIPDVPVLATARGISDDNFWGNLGQTAVRAFRSYTLDFQNMSFEVDPAISLFSRRCPLTVTRSGLQIVSAPFRYARNGRKCRSLLCGLHLRSRPAK